MSGPAPNPALAPVNVHLQLRSFATDLVLPEGTEVLRTREPEPLPDVRAAVLEALAVPSGTAPLAELCRAFLAGPDGRGGRHPGAMASTVPAGGPQAGAAPWPGPTAVVVISDNTRAVPYKGDGGILWPLVQALLSAGFPPESVTLLVASGTHRVLSAHEIWALCDDRVRQTGVRVCCHDAADPQALTCVGRRTNGDEVLVSRKYVEADLRILTGLVEPHLMAGVSGGRKSICPGLLSVQSVREFHGPRTLAHPKATALELEGNPCHQVSLEVARMARPDLILNVTTCRDGRVAGIYAGDMEQAHLAAVEHVRAFTQIPLEREYDVVVAHAGLVGVNHYQAEKAADVAGRAVRPGGYLVVVADTTDPDPLGTESYRRLIGLLAQIGAEEFLRRITADDWEFVHDQWGVQVWAQLLRKVPAEHIFYFSPQTPAEDYALLPGVDPRAVLGDGAGEPGAAEPGAAAARFVTAAVARACRESEVATGRRAAVACLADGPHGIPVGPASAHGAAALLPLGPQ